MAEPFRIIGDDEPQTPTSPPPDKLNQIGIEALMLGLSALSQRMVVGLSKLFTLITVASAFALWWAVMPNPTVLQLIGLGMFGLFVLAVNVIVRRA